MKTFRRFTAIGTALLLCVLLLIPAAVQAADASSERLLGDVDGDGDITILDATRIQRALAKLYTLTEEDEAAADCNQNDDVDILDATLIQRYLARFDDGVGIGEPISTDDPSETTEQTDSTEQTESTESTESTDPTQEAEVTGEEWKENTGTIVFNADGSITVTGEGVTVSGKVVTIYEGGDWAVSGESSDAMIYVDTGEVKDVNDKVKLRLNGVTLSNTDGPAIWFDRCKKAFITIEEGSVNTISDAAVYATENTGAKAAIHSDDSLEIKGKGTLNITGNYKHGICSDDDILIENGVIHITTNAKDGLHANDDITLDGKNIELTIDSADDGIDSEGTLNLTLVKSLSVTSVGKGVKADGDITIAAGSYTIKSNDDCINGNAAVTITGGSFTLTSGDEAVTAASILTLEGMTLDATTTGKGVKAETDLYINSGTYVVNSGDDSVHCNGNITISGGSFTLTSGDDGVHADTTLTIEDGTINITKSYEGLEGNDVIINGGNITLTASDDGINAAGGNDQSSQGNRPGQNNFTPGAASNNSITITGGYVFVRSSGDGIDSNGALNFNGGTVIVQGPTSGGNSPVDADGTINFSGGTVMAIASSNAMWSDINGKTGNAVYNTSIGSVSSGSTIAVTDSSGKILSVLKPSITGNVGIIYYTDRTSSLSSVKFVTNGTYSGTLDANGYAESGTYSGGSSSSPSSSSGGGFPPGGRF